jgi:quinol monooxygenase YgiN
MSGVVELRQYTLKPGRRDELIALFEREFVESQEAEGIDLIGTFRDLDDPDRFVWLRGFPDREARAKSLAAFYGGPIWKAHRNAANDTMIDSDNVLLLRPAWNGSGFGPGGKRAPISATKLPDGFVTATICYFDAPISGEIVAAFRDSAPAAAAFVTERSANTFPALPVREGENVFVRFSLPEMSPREIPLTLKRAIVKQETLRLQPTARSRLWQGG